MSPSEIVKARGGVWTIPTLAASSGWSLTRTRADLRRAEKAGRIRRVGGQGGGWSAERRPIWKPPCDLAVERTVDAIDHLTRGGGRAGRDAIAEVLGVSRSALRPVMAWLSASGLILTHHGRYGGAELA